MSRYRLVGLAGSYSRPSKTRALVEEIAARAGRRPDIHSEVLDLSDFGASLGVAHREAELDFQARRCLDTLVSADLLVIGSPTYKGSYPGLFKHLIDLLDPAALKGKPVIIAATGGGEKHALIVEHQLRPLFGFFQAFALPTALYASDGDFIANRVTNEALLRRVEQVVSEMDIVLPRDTTRFPVAAE